MIELRDMQLLLALARHKHFARAASECGISQPAFSMRIRNAEDVLGVSIVKRGNRFQGFTAEGEMVLRWARRITDQANTFEHEIKSAKGAVSGMLTVGVVPTALVYASEVCARLGQAHPGIVVRILSASSLQIQQGIDDGTMDAGVTYEDGVSRDLLNVLTLFDETYDLLVPADLAPRKTGHATWAEAAERPLSLLIGDMQNRRILDRQFSDLGLTPKVILESNAFSSSIGYVAGGFAATILPNLAVKAFGNIEETVVLPLIEPVLSKSICLVSAVRDPQLPSVAALFAVAEQ